MEFSYWVHFSRWPGRLPLELLLTPPTLHSNFHVSTAALLDLFAAAGLATHHDWLAFASELGAAAGLAMSDPAGLAMSELAPAGLAMSEMQAAAGLAMSELQAPTGLATAAGYSARLATELRAAAAFATTS